ncbi:hypothetical protein [Agarivorans sp. 1_MG-2023]|uniref:alginate O-acetyltransferase AlgX-related protein n=1 Tax=Agarivorans sp. 1_MG-2023 TaxID=3062634 RepID=UPI0026E3443F|nr:hypothetical protein [Agarivorans sp. 1_MG-2023]MDO6766031.1 hypothetical protein [Agarivorans sp. 1_MG-2023]
MTFNDMNEFKRLKLTISVFLLLLLISPLMGIAWFYYVEDFTPYESLKKATRNRVNAFGFAWLKPSINRFFYRYYISADPNSVIMGTEAPWMYLGDNTNQVYSTTVNGSLLSENDVASWSASVKAIKTLVESYNSQFLLILVPNKHTIYSEYLGNYVKGNYATQQLTEAAVDSGVHLLDLRHFMMDEKNAEYWLYQKTDSHWTNYGAWVAFRHSMNEMEENLLNGSGDWVSQPVKGGDLSQLLGVDSSLIRDENYINIAMDDLDSVCVELNWEAATNSSCEEGDKALNIHHQNYKYSTQIAHAKSAIVLADSFFERQQSLWAHHFSPLYVAHYHNSDLSRLEGELERLSPDWVVLQVIERQLLDLARY